MKRALIISIFIILLFPIISSVEFDIKSEYMQGETLIARVSGNFLDSIERENIFFYRGHVRIPMEFDVTKINDEFYIYALLDKPEDTYSLSIENIEYMVGKEVSDEDIVKQFLVNNLTADFSVKPGFINTNNDFELSVQNLQDKKINITIKSSYSEDLQSGEIKKLPFQLGEITKSEFSFLSLVSDNTRYEIPVYLFVVEDNTPLPPKEFKFEPSELIVSMPTETQTKRIIYLYNTGESDLENLSIYIDKDLEPYLLFSTEHNGELDSEDNMKIELDISSDIEEKIVYGRIIAKDKDDYVSADITLDFIKDFIPLEGEEEEEDIVEVPETCAEREGYICTEEQNCNGQTVYAKDDKCCLGTCENPGTPSNTGKIIGWLIVIVVFLFVVWFFKTKYRGAKKEVNLLNIGKKK